MLYIYFFICDKNQGGKKWQRSGGKPVKIRLFSFDTRNRLLESLLRSSQLGNIGQPFCYCVGILWLQQDPVLNSYILNVKENNENVLELDLSRFLYLVTAILSEDHNDRNCSVLLINDHTIYRKQLGVCVTFYVLYSSHLWH